MKHVKLMIYRVLIGLLIITPLMLVSSSSQAQTDTDDVPTPQETVMEYITAVNLRDYATAYQIGQPDESFESFVRGYADTVRIVPYFGHTGVAAGSVYLTTVLLGYQTDGSVESYYGYYQLANGGNYSPPVEGFVLVGGRFQLLHDGAPLNNSTIASLLSVEWQETVTLPTDAIVNNQMGTAQAQALLGYYDLINQRDFSAAYAQWLPAAADTVPPFADFVSGYDDTLYVTAYAGTPQGNYLPTVLVGHHFDGAYVTYAGCYAFDTWPNGQLGFSDASFSLVDEIMPDSETVFAALDNMDCASLMQ